MDMIVGRPETQLADSPVAFTVAVEHGLVIEDDDDDNDLKIKFSSNVEIVN